MALTEKQKLARRKGIGGSDLAKILGLDPFGGQAIDVFYEKLPELASEHGYVAKEVDETMDQIILGNHLEHGIALAYQQKTGRKVRKSHKHHTHKKFPFIMGNVDRLIVGERRGLEIKHVGYRMAPKWGTAGTDEVAEYYLPQVHHYLLVLDYPVWDVAAAIGGCELRTYEIERDKEWDEMIIDACNEFWGYVERREPPPINAELPLALESIKRVYPGTNGETIYLDDQIQAWKDVMEDAKSRAKEYAAVADKAKAHIQAEMGEAAVAVLPDGTGFTRKMVKRIGYTVEPTDYIDFRFTKKPIK